jgi:hypothetical protein
LPTPRHAALALSVSVSLGLAACGGGETTPTPAPVSNRDARKEAEATRAALRTALGELKRGDRNRAQNTVSEGYLQHFENVERPLDKVDHELKERLEEGIATTLRRKIASGAPVAEVEALISSADADLVRAEEKLR